MDCKCIRIEQRNPTQHDIPGETEFWLNAENTLVWTRHPLYVERWLLWTNVDKFWNDAGHTFVRDAIREKLERDRKDKDGNNI